MKVTQEERWRLLREILFPLILGGTSVGFITKADLPFWANQLFIILAYICFISIAVRVTFEDLIDRWRTWLKKRRLERQKSRLIKDWLNKWFELSDIIDDLITNDEPTDEHKVKFKELRLWFICNRSRVLPLWQAFNQLRTVQAHENYSLGVAKDVLYDHCRDPFSFFYDIYSLDKLKAHMKSRYYNFDEVRWVLSKLDELVIEFVDWHHS